MQSTTIRRFCGTTARDSSIFCSGCGAAIRRLELARIVPAALIGSAVAVTGTIVVERVSTPSNAGFFGPIAGLVYSTTFPCLVSAFAFLGGVSAAFSLARPDRRDLLVSSVLLAALHLLMRSPAARWSGWTVASTQLGVEIAMLLIGLFAAAPFVRMDELSRRFGPWFRWIPGPRPIQSALGVLLAVAAILLDPKTGQPLPAGPVVARVSGDAESAPANSASPRLSSLAGRATITASSVYSPLYAPANVADGVIGIQDSGEWASLGQAVGAWVELRWPGEVEISRIRLYDRKNLEDHAETVLIEFSDGVRYESRGVPNDGRGHDAGPDAPHRTRSVRFTILRGSATNVGFSEIEVLGR